MNSSLMGVGQPTLESIAAKAAQCRYYEPDDSLSVFSMANAYLLHSNGHSPDQVDSMVHEACCQAILNRAGMTRHPGDATLSVERFSCYLADRLVRDINSLEGFNAILHKETKGDAELQQNYMAAYRKGRTRVKFSEWRDRYKIRPVSIHVTFRDPRGTKRKAVCDNPDEEQGTE